MSYGFDCLLMSATIDDGSDCWKHQMVKAQARPFSFSTIRAFCRENATNPTSFPHPKEN